MNSGALTKSGWTGALLLGGAAATVLFLFDPARVPIYPGCVFHQVTGLDCPGCGSLRALHALLHGEVRAALRFNAFVVMSLPLAAWFAGACARQALFGTPASRFRPLWLWLYFASFLAFGVLRDLPVPLLAALAP